MASSKTSSSRVSIIDIATRAGVSPSTVSRVFNNPDLVQESTREAVLNAAHAAGYRPNASARTLRTQRSQVLGIVLPTLDNPVFAECLQGMTAATAGLGYAIMPVITHYRLETEQEAVEQLLSYGVDGVILVVSDAATSQAIQRLQAQDLPYVLIYNRHPKHPCVAVAGDAAMHEVVQGLAGMGHRRIGMVCGRLAASDRAQQRHAGFQEAMRLVGLDSSVLIEVPFIETAIQEIADALRQPARPTALVCSNDLIAVRAMRAAHECGLRIPDDISITGFDGIGMGHELTPSLSTVVQPNARMGATAANWLIDAITCQRLPAPHESITLPYQLRWAESCAAAPPPH